MARRTCKQQRGNHSKLRGQEGLNQSLVFAVNYKKSWTVVSHPAVVGYGQRFPNLEKEAFYW